MGYIKNEPLLYIDQPTFPHPKTKMQVNYTSTEDLEEQTKDLENKGLERNHRLRPYSKGNFADRSIKEKIMYLLQYRPETIKIKCLLITDDNKYYGTIKEFKHNKVRFQTSAYETKYIELNKINDLRLISL